MLNNYRRSGSLIPLSERLEKGPHFLQIIIGPRQVGKTTAIHQFLRESERPWLYDTADLLSPPDVGWIEALWNQGRQLAKEKGSALLVLDEIQKVPRWSEAVKRFHDQDVLSETPLRIVLLGSSALMVQKGLKESLAGRFELLPFSHWDFQECIEAFRLSFEEYVFFGSYPGALSLFFQSGRNEERWQQYVREALIETVIGKDILLLTPVDKPALFRQVFQLAAAHPAEILSFTKMMGQLQDAGNTTTIASYLQLLQSAELMAVLPRYSGSMVRQRASSPKLILLNNALPNAVMARSFEQTVKNSTLWGRLIENAVGAHLYNKLSRKGAHLFYWRERDNEVDFVLTKGDEIIGIEVKSSYVKSRGRGLKAFQKKYPRAKGITLGRSNADLKMEEFFKGDPLPLLGL